MYNNPATTTMTFQSLKFQLQQAGAQPPAGFFGLSALAATAAATVVAALLPKKQHFAQQPQRQSKSSQLRQQQQQQSHILASAQQGRHVLCLPLLRNVRFERIACKLVCCRNLSLSCRSPIRSWTSEWTFILHRHPSTSNSGSSNAGGRSIGSSAFNCHCCCNIGHGYATLRSHPAAGICGCSSCRALLQPQPPPLPLPVQGPLGFACSSFSLRSQYSSSSFPSSSSSDPPPDTRGEWRHNHHNHYAYASARGPMGPGLGDGTAGPIGPGLDPSSASTRGSPFGNASGDLGKSGSSGTPSGCGQAGFGHGPSPGLSIGPMGHGASPLPRPDHLCPEAMPDPVNIAADHECDPRDVIQRLVLQTASATGGLSAATGLPPWGSDQVRGGTGSPGMDEEIRKHQEQQSPLAGVMESSGPPSQEQLHRLSGPDLSAVALALLPVLPPGRVAQLAVALARLGHFDMQYKAVLVEHVVGRIYQFTPQQLADVAWAVAACGYYDLPFLEALADRLRDTAPQWDARSLAKVLWSFGRFHFVGREPSVGEEALEAMIEKLQGEMDGATVAEVVYAAGQLCGSGAGDWQFSRLQGLVADFVLTNIETFGPEALGKLASGLSKLGSGGVEEEVCQVVARRAAELAERLEPEDIRRVMDLLEAHGTRDWAALEALAARAAELSRSPAARLGPHQAAALVAAFNALGHVSTSVLELAERGPAVQTTPTGSFVG